MGVAYYKSFYIWLLELVFWNLDGSFTKGLFALVACFKPQRMAAIRVNNFQVSLPGSNIALPPSNLSSKYRTVHHKPCSEITVVVNRLWRRCIAWIYTVAFFSRHVVCHSNNYLSIGSQLLYSAAEFQKHCVINHSLHHWFFWFTQYITSFALCQRIL